MAKHRAECPKTKTPLLRRGAATAILATMLLGGLTTAPAAFAEAQGSTSAPTATEEVANERTMRAVITPREAGDYNISFEDAERLVIEHLGKAHMSSSVEGVSVASSTIYYYEVTLEEDVALTVEPVTEALDHLSAPRSAHVDVLPSDAGKLHFSLTVTTHHGEEVELPSQPVRGTLQIADNGVVSVGFVGVPYSTLKELGKDIISSNYPEQGIRVATTRIFYEVTSEEQLAFDLDIDTSVLAEMENAPEVKVVVTSEPDAVGQLEFYVSVTNEFPLEVEATEPAPEEEVSEVPPTPEEVTEDPAVAPAPPAPAAAEHTALVVEAQAQVENKVGEEDTAEVTAESFRVSSTAPAVAPATADDTEAPRTPATDREAGNAGSGGGDDSTSDQAEVPSGSTIDGVEPEAEDTEPGIEFEVGTTYSTDDELFIGDDERDELVPSEEVTTEQERLADTGVDGRVTVFAALSLALGGAILFIRRKFAGVTA